MTFRVPGGQIGRYKSITVGAPEFKAGDEVVLFLKAQGPSVPHVFGLNQGVFRVQVDTRTGRRTVMQPIADGAKARAADAWCAARATGRPLPLEQFAPQIRTVLQGGAR